MASISSLKSLCKETVYQHSKIDLTKDSKEHFWKNALDKMLDTKIGLKLLKNILDNPSKSSISLEYQEYSSSFGQYNPKQNGESSISRGLEEEGYYLAKKGKFKYVAEKFKDDQTLFHELFHEYQYLRDENQNIEKLKRALPLSSRDFDNRVEEEAIKKGENKYLKELGLPKRIDHRSSYFPPYNQMLNKSKEEQTSALSSYLANGIHIDALQLSEQFSNEDLEKTLKSDLLKSYYLSKDFIDLMVLLIERRKLNVSFERPKWTNLLIACLASIDTLEQFHKLEKLGAANIIKDYFLNVINPTAKEYFSIINYLISKKSLNINNNIVAPFFLNESIRYTKRDIELLDKLDANFQLKDLNDKANILFYLHPYDDDFISIVSYLTKQKNLDINTKNNLGNPFFLEDKRFSLNQLKSLGSLGADFTLQDNKGKNILFYLNHLEDEDFVKAVKYLIKTKNIDSLVQDPNGNFFWDGIEQDRLQLFKETIYCHVKSKRIFSDFQPSRSHQISRKKTKN